jgi:hypothetical protein
MRLCPADVGCLQALERQEYQNKSGIRERQTTGFPLLGDETNKAMNFLFLIALL